MAKIPVISVAAAIAMLDTLTALMDAGASEAVVEIYKGTKPADVSVAETGGDLLATATCSDPAFNGATDDNPGAVAAADSITGDTNVDQTGTASWFRVKDSNGLAILDGTCGTTSSFDMQLDSVAFVIAGTFNITSWNVRLAEQ